MIFSLPALALPASAVADEADDAAPPAAPARRTSMSYPELVQMLNDCKDNGVCEVESVRFTVASGETGNVTLKSGETLPITGIPEENPTNDSSPARLIAKLRDAKVQYTFPFSDTLAKYRKS
jgi:hypothetical protein